MTTKKEKKSDSPKMMTPEEVKQFFKGYYQSNGRIFLSNPRSYCEVPDLLELQKKGYQDFLNVYLPKLFEDNMPVWDLGNDRLNVTITDLKVSEPTESIETCKKKDLTYGGIITATIKLAEMIEDAKTGKKTEKVLYKKKANVGILPVITPAATYIINGVERVVISQIVRSYGIFYSREGISYSCKFIPENGSWISFEIEKTGNIVARINKSRKFPITSLFRIFGLESNEAIVDYFKDTFTDEEDINYIDLTLKKDKDTYDALSAAEFIYGKLRPGELIDKESALDYIRAQFMDPNRIHVGNIARRKINAKLRLKKPLNTETSNVFDAEDLFETIKYLINLANGKKGYYTDDSDHLANKRIRTSGELLFSHLQPYMRKFVKSVSGKLSVLNTEQPVKIIDIVNFKMIDNAIKSFFATSQLSQFIEQINPLSELEHKRRITALGTG